MEKYELLAPVGDFVSLRAAIDAGADAVYLGVKGFNMRDAASNFSLEDLPEVRRIAGDVKVYLTLNVVVYDSELERVGEIVRRAKEFVDAIVCWDFGVIEICRREGVDFHVSTQASVSNLSAALFYKKLGASRIVLARELTLEQIKEIAKEVEIECFCHGAMCVGVSGRCFMSEHIYGLSANRGKCAQLCRRSWKVFDDDGKELRLENSRVMSAKDLCTLPFVGEMKRAGVRAFKIEGRNRSAEYVGAVVREYRRALDFELSEEEVEEGVERLKKVYNRGFSSGFYFGTPTKDDFSTSENGEQTERKEFVGKVFKVWKRVGVLGVRVLTNGLKVGDSCYLISDKIGAKLVLVESMEVEGEGVDVVGKGEDVGVRFSGCGFSVGSEMTGCDVYRIVGRG